MSGGYDVPAHIDRTQLRVVAKLVHLHVRTLHDRKRTRLMGDAALVCSVQKWDTIGPDGTVNPPFMMRQTDYLEKVDGAWKVLHEHTSMAQGWDGTIE